MKKLVLIFFLASIYAQGAILQFPEKTELKSSLIKGSFLPIPTLNAFYLKQKFNEDPVELTVLRTQPTTIANKVSIEKIWNGESGLTSDDRITKDFGCQKNSSFQFECGRMISKHDHYQFQKLIWHKKKDLVLIQANTKKDAELGKKIAQSFKLTDLISR